MDNETKLHDSHEIARCYVENYCVSFIIPGIIRNATSDTPISIEIREGPRRGTELFTVFNGINFRCQIGLSELVKALPDGHSLILPHQVNIKEGDESSQITILEEISPIIENDPDMAGGFLLDDTVKVRLVLTLNSNRDYRTHYHRFSDRIFILGELKRISGRVDVDFQLCFFLSQLHILSG